MSLEARGSPHAAIADGKDYGPVQVLPSTACAYEYGSANHFVLGYLCDHTSKKVVGNVAYRERLDNLRPFPLRAAQTADVLAPLRHMNTCAYITGPAPRNRPVQERCISATPEP